MLRLATRRRYLLDHLHLPVESRRATLNQRHIRGQAHAVDMTTGIQVVQRIEYNAKLLKPVQVELAVFDVRMIGFQGRLGIKPLCYLSRNLYRIQSCQRIVSPAKIAQGVDVGGSGVGERPQGRAQNRKATYQCFGSADVFGAKEELAVQVAQIYRI